MMSSSDNHLINRTAGDQLHDGVTKEALLTVPVAMFAAATNRASDTVNNDTDAGW